MATGRVNIGGGGTSLNIYTQLTEPPTKEGIWIKTDTPYKSIINDLDIWFAGEWNNPSLHSFANFPNASATSVLNNGVIYNNELYVLMNNGWMYKYNIATNTWTTFGSILQGNTTSSLYGVNGNYTKMFLHNDYIYLFGTQNSSNGGSGYFSGIHKYHIHTRTLTYFPGLSYTLSNATIMKIGNEVWFTSLDSLTTQCIYNLDTDTLTKSSFIMPAPTEFINGYPHLMAGCIYYLDKGNSTIGSHKLFKYNPITKTNTQLANFPGGTPSKVVGAGKYIYVITTGSSSTKAYLGRFDIETETWSQMPVPETLTAFNPLLFCALDPSKIGVINYQNDSFRIYSYESKAYSDRTIVLYKIDDLFGNYKTELVTAENKPDNIRILSGFDEVYYYINNLLNKSLATYYGDGVQWVKFKN